MRSLGRTVGVLPDYPVLGMSLDDAATNLASILLHEMTHFACKTLCTVGMGLHFRLELVVAKSNTNRIF